MPPMVPTALGIGFLKCIRRHAPFLGGRLAREYESGHPRAKRAFRAAKRGSPDPLAPLFEATQRKAGLDIDCDRAPPPDRQCGQQFLAPDHDARAVSSRYRFLPTLRLSTDGYPRRRNARSIPSSTTSWILASRRMRSSAALRRPAPEGTGWSGTEARACPSLPPEFVGRASSSELSALPPLFCHTVAALFPFDKANGRPDPRLNLGRTGS